MGIIEVDLHGKTYEEGQKLLEQKIEKAGNSVYRIRVIHGYHGGTGLKNMIREEFGYGRNEKVIRIMPGDNQGVTELILREY